MLSYYLERSSQPIYFTKGHLKFYRVKQLLNNGVTVRAVCFVGAKLTIGAQFRYIEILVGWPSVVFFPMVVDAPRVIMRLKKGTALHSLVLVHIKIEWVNSFEQILECGRAIQGYVLNYINI
jgi:hypothetical protein